VLASNLTLLLAVAAAAGGGRDAGPPPDAARPKWVPTTKPVHLSEEASYPLRRRGDGYVYEAPTFEARVARDGVVTFKDKHGAGARLLSPLSSLKDLPRPKGPTLESTVRGRFDKRRRKPRPPATDPAPLPNAIDWQLVCPRGSSCDRRMDVALLQVRGSFDLTDELMRARGQDSYAPEKARFLSATFDFRIKLALDARKADMKEALDRLPDRLAELWADGRYSPRERRRLLFELWLETDRTPQGERAAGAIVDFVRGRLPCGAADGYSPEELEELASARFPPAVDCLGRPAP